MGRRPRDHVDPSDARGPVGRTGSRARVVATRAGFAPLLRVAVAGERLGTPEVRGRARRANAVRDIAECEARRRAHVPWRLAERTDASATARFGKSTKIMSDQGNGVKGEHGAILRERPGIDRGSRPQAPGVARLPCAKVRPLPDSVGVIHHRSACSRPLSAGRCPAPGPVGERGTPLPSGRLTNFVTTGRSGLHSSALTSTTERDDWVVAAPACPESYALINFLKNRRAGLTTARADKTSQVLRGKFSPSARRAAGRSRSSGARPRPPP